MNPHIQAHQESLAQILNALYFIPVDQIKLCHHKYKSGVAGRVLMFFSVFLLRGDKDVEREEGGDCGEAGRGRNLLSVLFNIFMPGLNCFQIKNK